MEPQRNTNSKDWGMLFPFVTRPSIGDADGNKRAFFWFVFLRV